MKVRKEKKMKVGQERGKGSYIIPCMGESTVKALQ